ncbi:MAG: hypothetical protein BWY74_04120 [Firmicutes bacterium ADurb.Bin419]|nr:MAG: hypothetical protein BWY74_04120 [Firmicutes bacterium ADurb.Bin419]
MDMVIGITFPALFFNSINIFPGKIGSVNLVVIILSTGTLTAPLAGLPAAGVGMNNFLGVKLETNSPYLNMAKPFEPLLKAILASPSSSAGERGVGLLSLR